MPLHYPQSNQQPRIISCCLSPMGCATMQSIPRQRLRCSACASVGLILLIVRLCIRLLHLQTHRHSPQDTDWATPVTLAMLCTSDTPSAKMPHRQLLLLSSRTTCFWPGSMTITAATIGEPTLVDL